MGKRVKRTLKQIEGLKRQIEEHKRKIREELGEKDTTSNYWNKEIELKFEPQLKEKEVLMKKLKKSKKKEGA